MAKSQIKNIVECVLGKPAKLSIGEIALNQLKNEGKLKIEENKKKG